jgi:hypothetical protein
MFIALLDLLFVPGIYSIDRITIALTFAGTIILLGAVLSIMRRSKS